MSDKVSIVAIVAGACGTLGGVLFGGWREDRRLRGDAVRAEKSDREALVSDAALAVTQALSAFEDRKTSSRENVVERGEAFNDRIKNVASLESRIAIRFGPQAPATDAYRVALIALRDLGREVFEAQREALDSDFGRENYNKVQAARDDFINEAQRTQSVRDRRFAWKREREPDIARR